MTGTIQLDGVHTLRKVLERLPQGNNAARLANSMGLWSAPLHLVEATRTKTFPTDYSRLEGNKLSDECAYWQSEAFRSTEIVGLLEGQRTLLSTELKSLRASTRARLRREHRLKADQVEAAGKARPKDPAATQLADEVEEDQHVQDKEQTLGMLLVVLESAKAYKEACLNGGASLSREISLQVAQISGGLR